MLQNFALEIVPLLFAVSEFIYVVYMFYITGNVMFMLNGHNRKTFFFIEAV